MGKFILVVSHGKGYLYRREGKKCEGNKHVYIGRLNDLKPVCEELGISREEAINFILELIKQRLKRTKKEPSKQLMEIILFDPELYFSN